MSSADLESNAGLESTPQAVPLTGFRDLISFLCPFCNERLNVATELAGVAGPCPSCANVIRAPRGRMPSMLSRQLLTTTSTITLPALEQGWEDGGRIGSAKNARPVSVGYGAGFSAVKKIEAQPVEGLDDSWREKFARERKQTRRRVVLDRWLDSFLMSHRAEKWRKIGTLTLSAILVVTIGALYLNHRSGGALFKRWLG